MSKIIAAAGIRGANKLAIEAKKIAGGKLPTLKCAMGGTDTLLRQSGQYYQRLFKKIGLDIEMDYMDWPTFLNKVKNKNAQMFMLGWIADYLPRERSLATKVWVEAEAQIANYVRGKVAEIFIVGLVTYVVFLILGLQYSALLATLVGFSVLIPYIGAAVATIPIALIAYFQFGWDWSFGHVMIAYAIIQALDGNLLVPLLFSEVVNLHPVAIILAILFFGGLWGFWGIFFAIPLATLVQAVLRSWPRNTDSETAVTEESLDEPGQDDQSAA